MQFNVKLARNHITLMKKSFHFLKAEYLIKIEKKKKTKYINYKTVSVCYLISLTFLVRIYFSKISQNVNKKQKQLRFGEKCVYLYFVALNLDLRSRS